MRKRLSLFLLAAVSLASDQGLRSPRFGWMRDSGGALRPLEGLAANAVPGIAATAGIISAASSGSWTLAKTSTELIALDDAGNVTARLETADGPGLYSFNRHNGPAAVFLPAEGRLLRWIAGRFEDAGWRPSLRGEALALAETASDRVSFLVRRDAEVWRVDCNFDDGTVTGETRLPGVAAPVLLFADGAIVYAAGRHVVFRGADSAERRIAMPGTAEELTQLNREWIQVTVNGRQVAVSFSGEAARFFELPEARR